MALLYTKACQCQKPDKVFADGVFSIRPDHCSWEPAKAGMAPSKQFLLRDLAPRSKAKDKPMMRVMTVTKQAMILLFATEADRDAALDAIAAAVAQLAGPVPAAPAAPAPPVPQATPAAGAAGFVVPDEATRKAFLTRDEDARELYNSLVPTNILSEAEFWRSMQMSSGVNAATAAAEARMRPGKASRLLDLLPHQADQRAERVSLVLSAADRAAILQERPHVRRAMLANVPHNMSEQDFWDRWARHYLAKQKKRSQKTLGREPERPAERGRAAAAQGTADDEIFGEDGSADALALAAAKRRKLDPTLDLEGQRGDAMPDSYGLAHQPYRDETEVNRHRYRGYSRELINEINTHAHVVLHGPEALTAGVGGEEAGGGGAGPSGQGGAAAGRARSGSEEGSAPPCLSEQRPTAGGLEDLVAPAEQHFEQLSIHNPRTYFEGGGGGGAGGGGGPPAPGREVARSNSSYGFGSSFGRQASAAVLAAADAAALRQPSAEQQRQAIEEGLRALATVRPAALAEGSLEPGVAHTVLLESWGGEEGQLDAQGRPLKPPALALSAERQRQLRTFALVVNELLRHLWACVPANTEAKQAKLERVVEALHSQDNELQQVMNSSVYPERSHVVQLLKPLQNMIAQADNAYNNIRRTLLKKASISGRAHGGGGGGPRAVSAT